MWCAIAAAFFSPPGGFLGQQIWSHSRHCLVAPDNIPGESLSEKWEDKELQEQCSGGTAKLERRSWKRSGVRGKQKPLKAQEEPLLGWAALSVCNQHLFHADKTMLKYTFAELMSSPNTHLEKSRLEFFSLYKQTL